MIRRGTCRYAVSAALLQEDVVGGVRRAEEVSGLFAWPGMSAAVGINALDGIDAGERAASSVRGRRELEPGDVGGGLAGAFAASLPTTALPSVCSQFGPRNAARRSCRRAEAWRSAHETPRRACRRRRPCTRRSARPRHAASPPWLLPAPRSRPALARRRCRAARETTASDRANSKTFDRNTKTSLGSPCGRVRSSNLISANAKKTARPCRAVRSF